MRNEPTVTTVPSVRTSWQETTPVAAGSSMDMNSHADRPQYGHTRPTAAPAPPGGAGEVREATSIASAGAAAGEPETAAPSAQPPPPKATATTPATAIHRR